MPLRILLTPVGETLETWYAIPHEKLVLPSDHEAALRYFRQCRDESKSGRPIRHPGRMIPSPVQPSVMRFDRHDGGHPYLANDYPAHITFDGSTFPTVEHAYWALATSDPTTREKIMNAPTAREARKISQDAPLRPNWNAIHLAVMLRLVREKFRQHPELAAKLLALAIVASSTVWISAATGAMLTRDATGWVSGTGVSRTAGKRPRGRKNEVRIDSPP